MSHICRTCLQSVERFNFFYIDTFDNNDKIDTIAKNMLQMCVPELDLYISAEAGVCGDCLRMFQVFYTFKSRCLDNEERIQNYVKKHGMEPQTRLNLACVVSDVPQPVLNGPQTAVELESDSLSDDVMHLLACKDCSFVTMDQEKFVQHECNANSHRFKCPHCEYATNRRYRLSYHINAKHTKTEWYHCTHCQYKTTDIGSLRRHLKMVHLIGREGGPLVDCDQCQFRCISEMALKRHKIVKHGPEMHCCTLCPYQTKDRSNFRKHAYVHGDKPKKCTECDYQCVSPYQLQKHFKRLHV